VFALTRADLRGSKVTATIRNLAARMPTYITLKEVKKRWGTVRGHFSSDPVREAVGDMTALPEVESKFWWCASAGSN